MKIVILMTAVLLATPGFAANFECPKEIQVEVIDLKSTSYLDQAEVDKIVVDIGENQTERSFVEAVLKSVNKIKNFSDKLKFQKAYENYPNYCLYKGSKSDLRVELPTFSEPGRAILFLGDVDYKNSVEGLNPISASGYQTQLVSELKKVNATAVDVYKSRANKLLLEMEIQIPLGDYGTDGFLEYANIGSAKTVTYTVTK
jgi:hypothetical protein